MRRWYLRFFVRQGLHNSQPIHPTDLHQYFLGPPPRAHNHDQLRAPHLPRTLLLLRLPQYHPINLRSPSWLRLPSFLHALFLPNPLNLPNSLNPLSPDSRRHNLIPRLSLRLRLSRPYRLCNLHPCQIMQAPACHVPPFDHLSQILSSLQIPRGGARDDRSFSVHALPPLIIL